MTRAQIEVSAVTAVIGSCFTWLVGGVDYLFAALLVFICVDYLSGVTAALFRTTKLSSAKGFKGICRKVFIIAIVAIAVQIDIVLNLESHPVRCLVIFFFLGNEGLSIAENTATIGVHFPPILKEKLEQLKNEKGVECNESTKN